MGTASARVLNPGDQRLHDKSVPAASDKADKFEQTSQKYLDTARSANQTGDDYVFVTVFLAVVLFFVAIAQRFDWPAIQIVVLGVGLVMLIIGLFRLFILPIN